MAILKITLACFSLCITVNFCFWPILFGLWCVLTVWLVITSFPVQVVKFHLNQLIYCSHHFCWESVDEKLSILVTTLYISWRQPMIFENRTVLIVKFICSFSLNECNLEPIILRLVKHNKTDKPHIFVWSMTFRSVLVNPTVAAIFSIEPLQW